MNPMQAVKACFGKYADFSGRAQRSEFWWFLLFIWVGMGVMIVVDSTVFGTVTTTANSFSASTNTPMLLGIFWLATLLPSLSVAVRRLHDTDRSGWWIFITLVPLIGGILYIVWQASKGTDGQNRFGNDPLGGSGGGYDDDDFSRSRIPGVGN